MSVHTRFVCFDEDKQIHIELEFDKQTNHLEAISVSGGVASVTIDLREGKFAVYIDGVRFDLMACDVRRVIDAIAKKVFGNMTLEQYEKMQKVIDEESKEVIEFIVDGMLDDIEDMMRFRLRPIPCIEFEWEE